LALSFSTDFVNSQYDEDRSPFYDEDCQLIIGSYDPNDKTATPTGVFEEHYIDFDTPLEYRIRFQNTGNDTAFQVIVVDTIDTNLLDISTLDLGVSSHDYELEIKNSNVLVFTFENILLVDSMTNEPASHGFFTFKIDQKPNNLVGQLILNDAAIYFDYNEPIITNEAFHTIGLPKETTEVNNPTASDTIDGINSLYNVIMVNVHYENNHIHLKTPWVLQGSSCSVNVYSLSGTNVIQRQALQIPNLNIEVGHLPRGLYIVEVQSDKYKNNRGIAKVFID